MVVISKEGKIEIPKKQLDNSTAFSRRPISEKKKKAR
jgi:hypothetical protein